MFYGYNGSARHSFGWGLIHVARLKNPMFAIPIARVVTAYLPEETEREESDYVKGFRETCSLKSPFAVYQGTKQQRAKFDIEQEGV
jgi:hypothetical protein